MADGLLVPTQRGIFGAKAGGDTARLYADVQKALNRNPTFFMIFGFDAGLIIEAAVKNSDGSRQGIRDALEKLKDLPAVNGPVTYSTTPGRIIARSPWAGWRTGSRSRRSKVGRADR